MYKDYRKRLQADTELLYTELCNCIELTRTQQYQLFKGNRTARQIAQARLQLLTDGKATEYITVGNTKNVHILKLVRS